MTNRERLIAALVALSLAGNAAAQGGPLTPLDDPRLQPVLRGADAGPADARYFGDVPSRLAAGGRDAPAVTQPPSVTQKSAGGRSAEENHEPLHHLWIKVRPISRRIVGKIELLRHFGKPLVRFADEADVRLVAFARVEGDHLELRARRCGKRAHRADADSQDEGENLDQPFH